RFVLTHWAERVNRAFARRLDPFGVRAQAVRTDVTWVIVGFAAVLAAFNKQAAFGCRFPERQRLGQAAGCGNAARTRGFRRFVRGLVDCRTLNSSTHRYTRSKMSVAA